MTAIVLALAAGLLSASTLEARQGDGDVRVAAVEHEQDASVFDKVRPLAEQGDVFAQFTLGVIYAKGRGVPQDESEAVSWFLRAATQGSRSAQVNLATMYREGRGVQQDFRTALRWYREAAGQGSTAAHVGMGDHSLYGLGVPQDAAKAASRYRMAAERGDVLGQAKLGVLYYRGQGVARDVVRSLMWLTLAEGSGNWPAASFLTEVRQEMTPAQIAEAERSVKEWQRQKEDRSRSTGGER